MRASQPIHKGGWLQWAQMLGFGQARARAEKSLTEKIGRLGRGSCCMHPRIKAEQDGPHQPSVPGVRLRDLFRSAHPRMPC